MGPLRELFATGDRETLEFFFVHLQDVCGSSVDTRELMYNASVLAHYAQISTVSTVDLTTPATLGAVFDNFVLDTTLRHDRLMMEAAGAQCLMLAGFFEDQMRRRHNLRWYATLGATFFSRAAAQERSPQRVRLLTALAVGFEPWRQLYAKLSRQLRDQPYLLTPPRTIRT